MRAMTRGKGPKMTGDRTTEGMEGGVALEEADIRADIPGEAVVVTVAPAQRAIPSGRKCMRC
jgi:hypothetical protein